MACRVSCLYLRLILSRVDEDWDTGPFLTFKLCECLYPRLYECIPNVCRPEAVGFLEAELKEVASVRPLANCKCS